MHRHEWSLYKELRMVDLHWRHTQTNAIVCFSQPVGYVALHRRTIINDKLEWCRDLVEQAIPQLPGNYEGNNEKSQSKCGSTWPRVEELPPDCEGGVGSSQITPLLRLASTHSSPLKSSGYFTHHHVCHSHILLVRSVKSVNVLYTSQKKQRLFH